MSNKPELKAVLDTNVLFSAIGWNGPPFECLIAAGATLFELLTCTEIIEELQEKLVSKLGMTRHASAEAIDEVLRVSTLVALGDVPRVVIEDRDDDAVLACAVQGGASFLVSGDKHLLTLKRHQGIEILNVRAFLDILERHI